MLPLHWRKYQSWSTMLCKYPHLLIRNIILHPHHLTLLTLEWRNMQILINIQLESFDVIHIRSAVDTLRHLRYFRSYEEVDLGRIVACGRRVAEKWKKKGRREIQSGRGGAGLCNEGIVCRGERSLPRYTITGPLCDRTYGLLLTSVARDT